MSSEEVLISGAGIAGATAAHWLARAGCAVTIVELFTATRTSGNPVDVRGRLRSWRTRWASGRSWNKRRPTPPE